VAASTTTRFHALALRRRRSAAAAPLTPTRALPPNHAPHRSQATSRAPTRIPRPSPLLPAPRREPRQPAPRESRERAGPLRARIPHPMPATPAPRSGRDAHMLCNPAASSISPARCSRRSWPPDKRVLPVIVRSSRF
jgi:hypothetical protein